MKTAPRPTATAPQNAVEMPSRVGKNDTGTSNSVFSNIYLLVSGLPANPRIVVGPI